jgi:hypothetical protein
MSFVTFAERYGFEKGERKGLAEGMKQAIEVAIRLRFPDALPSLKPLVMRIDKVARLQQLLQLAETAPLAEIEAALA